MTSETFSDSERQKTTIIQGCHHRLHSCPYYNQNEVWVDKEISENWFHKNFVQMSFLEDGITKSVATRQCPF
jgi:hypothetical protein